MTSQCIFHPPYLLTKHIILIPKSIKLYFVLLTHTKPPQQLSQEPQKWYNIFASVRHSRTEREGWAAVIRPRQKFNLHCQYAPDTVPRYYQRGSYNVMRAAIVALMLMLGSQAGA